MLRPTCQLGKVDRHFGGCGPTSGNEGATHAIRPIAARAFILVDALPRNEAGKLLRAELTLPEPAGA